MNYIVTGWWAPKYMTRLPLQMDKKSFNWDWGWSWGQDSGEKRCYQELRGRPWPIQISSPCQLLKRGYYVQSTDCTSVQSFCVVIIFLCVFVFSVCVFWFLQKRISRQIHWLFILKRWSDISFWILTNGIWYSELYRRGGWSPNAIWTSICWQICHICHHTNTKDTAGPSASNES